MLVLISLLNGPALSVQATTITLSVMNIPPRRRGSEADQMLDNKDMPGLRRQTTTATAAAAAETSGGHAGRAAGVQHQLPAAHAHLVPILLQPAARVPLSDLDWTVTAVLPSIDGVRFMADVVREIRRTHHYDSSL